jgi:hypothetical protein
VDNIKLRIRLGDREIEAEGPQDVVEQQIERWKQIFGQNTEPAPQKTIETPLDIYNNDSTQGNITLRRRSTQGSQVEQLSRGLVLLLYGYKTLQATPEVLSPRLARDLRLSGFTDLTRLSRAFARLNTEGLAVQIGKGKGTRYRLTEPGTQAAEKLLQSSLAPLT